MVFQKKVIFVFLIFLIIFSANAQNYGYLKLKINSYDTNLQIDGKLYKKTYKAFKYFSIPLAPGVHEIKVTKDGYYDEIRKVKIKPNEVETLEINFRSVSDIKIKKSVSGTIVQAYGKLTVLSEPEGATITLPGVKGEITPSTFDVPTGRIKVTVELNGIKKEKYIKITKNHTSVLSFNLTPKYGKVTIITDPANADIYINDSHIGVSPLTKSLLVGNYSIRIAKKGYDEVQKNIQLYENKIAYINSELLRKYPTELTAEDIGRPYKAPIKFNDYKKEYKIEYVPSNAFLYVLASGVGLAVLTRKSTHTSMFIWGLTGVVSLITSFITSHPKKVFIKKNIEYNRMKREEIKKENMFREKYNKETKRILNERNKINKKKVYEFNKNRKTVIIYKNLK